MNRHAVRLIGLVMLGALLASACSGGAGGGAADSESTSGSITVLNFANYMPEDLPARFTEATGIEVEVALTSTNEESMARIDATQGAGLDVVFLSSPFAESLQAAGGLAELDQALLTNLDNLTDEVAELAYDPDLDYSVPYAWGTTGLCYREDLVEQAPSSWWDLLDPSEEMEGRITMLQTDRWLMLPALKVLGYSANTSDEEEIAEATELLQEAKGTLLGYDDTTFYSKLVSGEAVMTQGWDGWCNYGTAEDENIAFVVPEEGSDLFVDVMVIPAASENVEAAHQFIDMVLEPDNGLWVMENILYKVPNDAAVAQLDPEMLETYPNLALTPEFLLDQELLRDLGEAGPLWTRAVSEIGAF